MVAAIEIASRKIGPGEPCFIIAEAGVNHNGDAQLARQLVDAAADAGADAVKFQTFKASRLVSDYAPKAEYQLQTTDVSESQLDMLRKLELSSQAHQCLQNYCKERDILFISSPFGEESADLLSGLDVPVFKIPSGEITNLPFLTHVAQKGKPLIVSTGMANLGEVENAVNTIEAAANREVILLHCVSNYPADPEDVNLRAMHIMASAFNVPVGYSDHTLGIEVSLAAVALGACVIEKHITLDSALPGPDHRSSLTPSDFADMVRGIRTVESAVMGHGRKEAAASEISTAEAARKSLVAERDINAGTILTLELISVKRPGTGLPPAMRSHLLGRKTLCDISAGELIEWRMLG